MVQLYLKRPSMAIHLDVGWAQTDLCRGNEQGDETFWGTSLLRLEDHLKALKDNAPAFDWGPNYFTSRNTFSCSSSQNATQGHMRVRCVHLNGGLLELSQSGLVLSHKGGTETMEKGCRSAAKVLTTWKTLKANRDSLMCFVSVIWREK